MNSRIKISTVIVVVLLIVYGLSYGISTFEGGGGYDIVCGEKGIERISRRTGDVRLIFESNEELYFVQKGNKVYVAENEKLFEVSANGKSRRLIFEGDGCIVTSGDDGLIIDGRYIYFAQVVDDQTIHGRLHLRKLEFEQAGNGKPSP